MDGFQTGLTAQILYCIWVLAVFIAPCVVILVPLKFFTEVPAFVFRKLMHIVACVSAAIMILQAESWKAAALTFLLAAVLSYPVLGLLEKTSWYDKLLVQKGRGEVRRSLSLYYMMLAVLTALMWGICGKQVLAAAAVLMWGTGDAAAALVGIPFGKHPVKAGPSAGKKTWEGSAAMFAVSFLCGAVVLLIIQGRSSALGVLSDIAGPGRCIFSAGFAAAAAAAAELFSPGEYDNITIPVATGAVLILCSCL